MYKQALLFTNDPEKAIPMKKRISIWTSLLKMDSILLEYEPLKEKILSDKSFILNVDEVINLDVQRSLVNIKSIDPTVLSNILKTYAFFNPEIEYCQGMNFLAGFLFLVYREEETAFKAFLGLIDRFRMEKLFS